MNYETAEQFTTTNDYREHEYAGFWIRFVASLIDGIVLAVPLTIFSVIFISLISTNELGEPATGPLLLMYVIDIAAIVLYFVLLTSSRHQGTVGKMLVGIKVVDRFGDRIGKGRAFGRYLAYNLSGLFFNIGYIIAAFTPKKQALHDFIATTYVVKK